MKIQAYGYVTKNENKLFEVNYTRQKNILDSILGNNPIKVIVEFYDDGSCYQTEGVKFKNQELAYVLALIGIGIQKDDVYNESIKTIISAIDILFGYK